VFVRLTRRLELQFIAWINPPIDPLNYLQGVKVVDIGDLRVARGKTRRPVSTYKHKHKHIVYDSVERRVRCEDCEQEIDAFDAFLKLVDQHDAAWKKIQKRHAEVVEAEKFVIRRLATKALDKIWRGKMLPQCAECGVGKLPEDCVNISGTVSREYVVAHRKRQIKE